MAATADVTKSGIEGTKDQSKTTAEAVTTSSTLVFSDQAGACAAAKKDDSEKAISQITLNQIQLNNKQLGVLDTILSGSVSKSRIWYKDVFELIEALGCKYEFLHGSDRIPSRSQFKLSYSNTKKVEYRIATPGRKGNDHDVLLPYTIHQLKTIFSDAGFGVLIPKVQTSEDLAVAAETSAKNSAAK